MVNNEEILVDEAWAFSFIIPADVILRRKMQISFKMVAIVGVNVRVECTNGAETADCSVPAETSTEDMSSTATADATTATADATTVTSDTAETLFGNTAMPQGGKLDGTLY